MEKQKQNQAYAKSKYLFYTCWETMGSHGGIIAGNLLHEEFAQTKEEADEVLTKIKEKYKQDPYAMNLRFVYIDNNLEWWMRV